MIGDRIVDVPSYIVKVDEESKIRLAPDSSFNELLSETKEQEVEDSAEQS
jgi:ribosomal protein S4